VLADPWSFPTDAFVERSYDVLGDLPLVGGLASGSGGAGATRLLLDGRVYPRGCVGVVLGGDLSVHSLVSHGCRPIGLPMTVTRSSDDMLVELAGRPAFEQARAAVAELDHHDQVAALQGLLVGLAIDEYVEEHGASDFLARTIVAADEELGTISLAGGAPVGSTVQFLLRDAAAASGELASLLDDVRCSDGGQSLAGALVFSGSSRGRDMFATPDHDVRAVREGLGIASAAGFFAAGEIGPVAGRNHLQGFTATVLAFES
jgi:small ligand-binding sensory domain FIST